MIARYTRPDMGAIWSERHKYECWLEVELAASEALANLGEEPREAATALRSHAAFNLAPRPPVLKSDCWVDTRGAPRLNVRADRAHGS